MSALQQEIAQAAANLILKASKIFARFDSYNAED
jgi:hypothetical protein